MIKYPRITLSETQQHIVDHTDGSLLVSGIPGCGKCLEGDALVSTSEGMLKIEDCEHIDTATCLDLNKYAQTNSQDARWYDMGVQATIKIRTDTGIELCGTPEHPLLVWDRDFTWKRLDQLHVDDHVLLLPGHSINNGTCLSRKGVTYLLGLLIGDAYTRKRGYEIAWSRGGKYLPKIYYELVNRFWNKSPNEYKKKNAIGTSHVNNSKYVWQWLDDLQYPLEKLAGEKYVPPWIFKATSHEQAEFLRGYFDTDGSVLQGRVELVSASEQLARQTQQLLIGLGVVPILRPKKVDGYEQTYWRLTISGDQARTFHRVVGFGYEEDKQRKLDELINRDSNPNKGVYPHTSYLLYKMKYEWKSRGCWFGHKQKMISPIDNTQVAVNRYLYGIRQPSRESLSRMVNGFDSIEARKLQLLTHLYPDPIVNIDKGPTTKVYDLTIPKHHNFVANGIISHNSRVIVERITRMLNEGVRPDCILATTFTRKAADEMNNRLKHKGVNTDRMSVQTMHALCWRIIRTHKTFKGWKVDDKEVYRIILKQILGYKQLNWQGVDIGCVEMFIAFARNNLVPPNHSTGFMVNEFKDPRYSQVYKAYENQMNNRKLITFDDMLYYGVWLLEHDQIVLDKIQGKYLYVMVDEFQDSNFAQLRLAEIIAAPEYNYMATGDIDQAVYSWRGALPEFMLEFAEKYDAEVMELGVNYRCAPAIMNAAAQCIVHNEKRFSKEFLADRTNEADISFMKAIDTDEEAFMVREKIEAIKHDGVPYGQIKVLYRVNSQSRAIEEEFIRAKIPFVVLGSLSFYNRKEIADLLAYLQVLYDPRNCKAGSRAINRPFRYVSKYVLDEIEDLTMRSENYIDAAADVLENTRLGSARDWVEMMGGFDVENDTPSDVLHTVVEETNYIDYLMDAEGTDTPETSRAGNVGELIASATRFNTIPKFIEYVEMQIKLRKRNQRKHEDSRVQVMTIHRVKGAEANTVFLIGANEGVIPHVKGDIEEERRLFYVAITRAKDRFVVSAITKQNLGTTNNVMCPSRFVYEAGILVENSEDEDLTHS